MACNWVFSYHQMLAIPASSESSQDVVRAMANGLQFTYKRNPDGTYTSPASLFDVLTWHDDGTFTIREANGFRIHFDTAGPMVSQVDRFGNTMTFHYNSNGRLLEVVDTLGHAIRFAYHADSDHINTITDFMGRSIRYFYDTNRELVAVRTPTVTDTPNGNDFPAGKFWLYTYSSGFNAAEDPRLERANHNLLTVRDPQGNVYLRNGYNNDPQSYQFDRVVEQQFGDQAQTFNLSYEALNGNAQDADANTPRNRTITIDRNGNRLEYIHNFAGKLLQERRFSNRDVNPHDPDVFVQSYSYNADGLMFTHTYPEGDVITYTYDSNSPLRYMQRNVISHAHTPGPRGATQTELRQSYSYELVYNRIRASVDRRGFKTVFTFDYQHADNLPALAAELGRSESETANLLSGLGIALTGGISGQIAGNVVRVDMPAATRPDGSTQAIYKTQSFNRFGQPIEEVDAQGIVTTYQHFPENDPDGDGTATVTNRSLATDTGSYQRSVTVDARLDERRTRPGAPLAITTSKTYDAPLATRSRRRAGAATPRPTSAMRSIKSYAPSRPSRSLI